ncbi:MAG: discoidin domain-containing protein [Clostridia bacterium]|nr:discoidin domain-containing protein [Clostridia bacterium]
MRSIKRCISAAVLLFMLAAMMPCLPVFGASYVEYYNFSDFTTGKTPDMHCVSQGVKQVVVAEYPDAENKSLLVQTAKDATQFWMQADFSSKAKVVIEGSFAYEGIPASNRTLFSLSGDGGSSRFMSADKSGAVKLYDGTVVGTLRPGVFFDVEITMDFVAGVYNLKINGKTQILERALPEGLTNINYSRFALTSMTADTEIFYVNYYGIKAVEDDKTEESAGQVIEDATASRAKKLPVVQVTDKMVTERMANHILLTTNSAKALVNNTVKALDDSNPDFSAEVVDGRTMVPLRFISEGFGATVNYDAQSGEATIASGGKTIVIRQGDKRYTVNGEEHSFDVPAFNKSDRLLVPLRAIAEILDKQVFYDTSGYIVIGENAESFNLSDKADKKIIDKAVRNVIFDTTTPEEVVTALKANNPDKAHPRLMVNQKTLPALKDKIKNDPMVNEWLQDLLSVCDGYLTLAPLKHGRTDGVRMLTTSRKALSYISSLSFAYLVTGEEKYAQGATDIMMNVCCVNFPDWNPYHWLDVAEMTAAVAIGYDWCYDYLSDYQKMIIRTGIASKGLNPGLDEINLKPGIVHSSGYWADNTSDNYPSNWVSVCSGGLILGALAIGDESEEESALAGEIVSRCIEMEKDLLAKFAPDGAWVEGPGYWRYAYQYFSYTISSLKTALGTNYGLTKSPGLHKGAYFMTGVNGAVANFDLANTEYTALDTPQLMWLSHEFDDAALAKYRTWFLDEYHYRASLYDIIWYNPEYLKSPGGIPTETNTREFAIASTRSGFGEEEFYVAFHGADDGGGRVVDMDAGTYLVDLFGHRWVMDSGSEGATYTSYAGVGLRDYYRMRAEGHNTIVLNPSYYEDQNFYALKDIDRFEHNDRYTIMASDFTNVYEFKGAKSFKRGVMVDKVSMTTTVQDELKLSVPSDFYSFIHVGGTIEIASDGRSAVITQGANKMQVQLVGDSSLKFEKMNAVPLETSPKPYSATDDSARWKLMIHSKDVTETKYAVVISPLCGKESTVVSNYTMSDIDSWTLPQTEELPKLSGIMIEGQLIEEFSPDKKIYNILYDPLAVGGKGANLLEAELTAEGDGEISVEPISDNNYCARISVTKNGATNYYFVNIKELASREDAAKYFPQVKPEFVGVDNTGLTQITPKSFKTDYIPQPENPPAATLDGDYTTRWSASEYMSDIVYDLGEVKNLSHVGLGFYLGTERQYLFKLAVSEDGQNWEVITTAASSGRTADMEIYNVGNKNARYVKLIGYGNSSNYWFNVTEIGFFTE